VALRQKERPKLDSNAAKPILNGLRTLGLTSYEAQAYVVLIQNPDISATELCNLAGIPDSKVYFALEELQKKGLVVVSEGVPRRYRGLRPKEALAKLKAIINREFESQVEQLDQLTLALEPLYSSVEREDIELAYVVKGFGNVLDRMSTVLKSAKREAIVFIPEVSIYDRLAPLLANLRHSGLKVRLAVPPKVRRHVDSSRFTEVRETTSGCEDCWLAIADGKTVISSSNWNTDRCHAILTQDPVLVAMSLEYYASPRCCIA
jgi:sugar-specific transcriptional regulator TrmB